MSNPFKIGLVVALLAGVFGFATLQNRGEKVMLPHDHDGDGIDDHTPEQQVAWAKRDKDSAARLQAQEAATRAKEQNGGVPVSGAAPAKSAPANAALASEMMPKGEPLKRHKKPKAKPTAKPTKGTRMTPEGLKIEDLTLGSGTEAKSGDHVTVNYTGTLDDGTKFDSSLNPGRTPFDFNLGAGNVIKGWDLGVAGMKEGGKRRLTIPPALGYGAAGTPGGPIPPNATLHFDVELLKVG